MDQRTAYRFMHTRKLETYAAMAGMTVYRNENNQITEIIYEDYGLGSSLEAWERRQEQFPEDEDEERLPDKSCDRYCLAYWQVMDGPYRHRGGFYKTEEIIAKELEEEKEKARVRIEKKKQEAQEKIAAMEARRAYYRAAAERDRELRELQAEHREQARIKAAELARKRALDQLDQTARTSLWMKQNLPPRPVPLEIAPPDPQQVAARRARQAAAMTAGAELSSPQRVGCITWVDPDIKDGKLVKLVLGPYMMAGGVSREMTSEEKDDYWYWMARGWGIKNFEAG